MACAIECGHHSRTHNGPMPQIATIGDPNVPKHTHLLADLGSAV